MDWEGLGPAGWMVDGLPAGDADWLGMRLDSVMAQYGPTSKQSVTLGAQGTAGKEDNQQVSFSWLANSCRGSVNYIYVGCVGRGRLAQGNHPSGYHNVGECYQS